jgi:hypothetical protein
MCSCITGRWRGTANSLPIPGPAQIYSLELRPALYTGFAQIFSSDFRNENMSIHRRCLPRLEMLENRWIPAGTVTGSFANGTWTLIGDAEANEVLINPPLLPGSFTVTGLNGTVVAGVTEVEAFKHLVIKLGAGDDRVQVNDTGAFSGLPGNLTIRGGSGANTVRIQDFKVRNLTIINGVNASSADYVSLVNSIVQYNVTINNGDGASSIDIYGGSSIPSAIGGNLTIRNGIGENSTYITDTHIGGNVTVKNGLPDPSGDAGYFLFSNVGNVNRRSVIGGNVFVSYQGGNSDVEGLWDAEVRGNVRFKYGSGSNKLHFDGYALAQPVHIHGNLTVTSQGVSSLTIGRTDQKTGLIVDKNFTVRTGAEDATLFANQLQIGGATLIQTGAGSDEMVMDNCIFAGRTTILTGAGPDKVHFASSIGSEFGVQFLKPLQINTGADNDGVRLGHFSSDTNVVLLLAKARLNGGTGDDDLLDLYNVAALFEPPAATFFEFIND